MSRTIIQDRFPTSTVTWLANRLDVVIPTGAVVPYAGSSAPEGYFLCNGQAVNRTTYSDLFNIIGTTYGVGDGSTTFNVPDLRSRFPLCAGAGAGLTARALATTGGEETHQLTVPEMPSHTHGVTDPGHNHTYVNNVNDAGVTGVATTDVADDTDIGATTGSSTTGISINSTGGDQPHNNMPPFFVLNFIIKHY